MLSLEHSNKAEIFLWKEAYKTVKESEKQYLELTSKNAALKRFLIYCRNTLSNRKLTLRPQQLPIREPKVDPVKMLAVLARKKGNEFSEKNKQKILTEAVSRKVNIPKTNGGTKERLKVARKYGNKISRRNQKKILEKLAERKTKSKTQHNQDMEFKPWRLKKTYGQYYSQRNRLTQKDKVRQFDDEFKGLLVRCTLFEENHLDVRGFLEEKLIYNSELYNKLDDILKGSNTTVSDKSKADKLNETFETRTKILINLWNPNDSHNSSQHGSDSESIKSGVSFNRS